jgi:uncharacterized membrane protein
MRFLRFLPSFLVLLLLASLASAAVIRGTVYDIGLDRLRNAVVEVNTVPRQVTVAANGTYAFTVGRGDYVLTARALQDGAVTAQVSERLKVQDEGEYVLDLILFPEIDNQTDIFEGTEEIDPDEALDRTTPVVILLWLIGSLVIAFAWAWFHKRKEGVKHGTPGVPAPAAGGKPGFGQAELDAITAYLRDQGGRTTQKDIRKQLGLSEAKVSLILAELEHHGVIEKIKKGRGNIVLLKQ